jgi:hypothetical protein
MGPMRRLPLIAVLALACACQTAVPTLVPPTLVPIPTAEPPGPNAGCMDALLTGQIVVNEDAGIAVQAADGSSIVVVWPHGWAAVDQDGMRILLNDRGDPIARVGDHISVGGGQGADGRWHTCGEVTRLP